MSANALSTKSVISKKDVVSSHFRLGIIAGGQLGKMLAEVTNDFDISTVIMDNDDNAPASSVSKNFIKGDFKSFEDVYRFGKKVDLLTLEIEHVNIEALLKLKEEGLEIHPDPDKLKIIQDKSLQKYFFEEHGIKSSPFKSYDSFEALQKAIELKEISFPFVQKARKFGYDGKGVAVIASDQNLDLLLETPSLIEEKVDIQKELSVIVARNENGEVSFFEPVEMIFNESGNLVETLICPANISDEIKSNCIEIALKTINALKISGVLAVELFLTKQNEILVNEIAPRPHNSGHHTIESCITSQFEQHIRSVLNWPLGNTGLISSSVMLNLLGDPNAKGNVKYVGLEECLRIDGAKFHIYGKKITKPLRKMGHVTILDPDLDKALEKAQQIKLKLNITT